MNQSRFFGQTQCLRWTLSVLLVVPFYYACHGIISGTDRKGDSIIGDGFTNLADTDDMHGDQDKPADQGEGLTSDDDLIHCDPSYDCSVECPYIVSAHASSEDANVAASFM